MVIAVLTIIDGVYKDAAESEKYKAQLTVRGSRVLCGVPYCTSVHVTLCVTMYSTYVHMYVCGVKCDAVGFGLIDCV